ncbi:NUDIX hydrolase [Pigmentiphaga soli]|uniref:NUDIX hydrolase n=1 Tax=Pigmentiphaga soli TaxID=1007095 RepID=A0ABP8GQ90_9BURK
MTVPLRAASYFPAPRSQRYCSQCGNVLTRRIPDDDNRERDVCDYCGAIHYQNPRNVLGTIPVWEDKVLLCRRAIEPRRGFWTLPAGFMELGETTAQGAARETREEAGAHFELGELFAVIDIPQVDQVHFFFLARLTDLDFSPGEESLEVALFAEADIPWRDLAFRSISTALTLYFEDRTRGAFGVHSRSLPPGVAAPVATVPSS